MKKLKYFIPLFAMAMLLTTCQKENVLVDQINKQPEQQALKKHPVPFHAEFTSTVLSTNPNEKYCGTGSPTFNLIQSLEGNATHMGNITGAISSCINPVEGLLYNAHFTLIAANGDELYLYRIEPDETEITIDGGTGRFADAVGTCTGFFELVSNDPLQFYNELDGEIQY